MPIDIVVPNLGDSIKQAILVKWHKADGERVNIDDALCELETEKANVDIRATDNGTIKRLKKEGDTVLVGEPVAKIEPGAGTAKAAPKPALAAKAAGTVLEDYSPSVRKLIEENRLDPKAIPATGPNQRLTREDVDKFLTRGNGKTPGKDRLDEEEGVATKPPVKPAAPQPEAPKIAYDSTGVRREPMTKMREAIGRRLVEAQHNAAILTTFNEVDLTSIIDLRTKYKERFQEVHGVGLGFMSFFARACALALKEFPRVNAFIDGKDVLFHDYVNMGIAVSTDRGLAVPVLRNLEKMSFAKIESEIKRVATATREGKLSLEELSGGTFTITNGGVFGSLLSTPIINPPQSGILGMHAIQKRPMVVNDKIEIRSMMYLALSYDHRMVDGRESVSFLVRVKQYLEDPARLILEI